MKICNPVNLAVTDDLATTQALRMSDQTSGTVRVPTGSSLTTLTWYISETEDGTYAVFDDAGTSGAQTVEGGKAYSLPAALASVAWAKAVGNVAETVHLNLVADL